MKLSASLFAVILPLVFENAARAQISLDEAVETPGLSWVTGGSKPWQALLAADAKSGGDLARCGPMSNGQFFWGGIDVTGWMETEVTGPGTFRIFVRSNFDPYLETSLSVDGLVVESMEMEIDWRQGRAARTPWRVLSCPLPAGRHTVRLTACLGCGGEGTIPLEDPTIEADMAAVLPPAPGAAEALDAPQVTWLTGGDPGYSPVNDVTHDGTDALHSPALSDSPWLQTEIEGPVTVSWWRKGSAVVSIEGLAVSSIPFAEWTRESAFVPPGKHQVRWSNVANDVWLDEFTAGAESPVGLAGAVDAPSRVFTASHGWQGHTSTTAPDGVDFAWTKTSGEPQWMETTVVGPALVKSRWRVRGVGSDLQVLVDGQMVTSGHGLNEGENGGFFRLIVQPGSHVVRWQASPYTWENPTTLVMLDEVKVGPVSPQSLNDALDVSEHIWTTGGDAPWLGLASGEASDSLDLAYSPALTGQQSAWLETTVTGPGSLNFQWKSLTTSNTRRVWVDDQVVRDNPWNRSGNWRRDAVEVPPGIHRIRWEIGGPCGAGAMLVDDVRWLAAGPPPAAAALDFFATALYADGGWSTDSAVHTDGVDSLRMEPVDGYPGNSIAMLVNGPALLTLKTRSVDALLRLSTAGHEVQSSSNEWTTLTVYVASGWRPVYLNSSAIYAPGVPQRASWVDAVKVTSSAIPLAEALRTPGRVWLTNPANPWGGTNGSATAGPANPNAVSWLETTVTGPAVVSFAVSGYLELLMNGSLHSTVNSETDYGYRGRRIWVPPGTHTLRWSDSLNSRQLVSLIAVHVSAMSAAPSLSRVGDTVHFTIPRPAGYTDSNIQIESSTALTGGFYPAYGTTVRSNDAELVISLPISPGTPRLFVRAKFLP
jgi:hypothetical protein